MGKFPVFAAVCAIMVVAPASAPASAQSGGGYPVCSTRMQDGCQNPGEGGAPGQARASDANGGQPAHGAAGGWSAHHRMHHARHHRVRHHHRHHY